MSRDFEFRQLLRAYRSGIISESTFEHEVTALGGGASRLQSSDAAAFTAFGKTYKSERAAIVSFLDKVRAGEANGGEAFAAWAKTCKTECIFTGIRMIAERESYHARIFGKRVAELGGEPRAGQTEEGRKFTEMLANPETPDNQKLMRLTSILGKPEDAVAPIREFAALIREDLSTKEALRLFAEDELSTARWIWDACAALNSPGARDSTASTAPLQ